MSRVWKKVIMAQCEASQHFPGGTEVTAGQLASGLEYRPFHIQKCGITADY